VQFCFLPSGEDPDTYLKTYDKQEFNKLLHQSKSLIDTLWNGYIKKLNITSKAIPEEKTILKKEILEHINQIQDGDLKQFFQRDFNDKFYNYFNTFIKYTKKTAQKDDRNESFSPVHNSEIMQTLRKVKKNHLPAKILLATLKNNPTLVSRVYEEINSLDDLSEDLIMFRDYLCEHTFESTEELTATAVKYGFSETLTYLDSINLKSIASFALPGVDVEVAFQGWMDVWQQHYFRSKIQRETRIMKRNLKSFLNEKSWEQWLQIKTVLNNDSQNL
jgi:DNA primase